MGRGNSFLIKHERFPKKTFGKFEKTYLEVINMKLRGLASGIDEIIFNKKLY